MFRPFARLALSLSLLASLALPAAAGFAQPPPDAPPVGVADSPAAEAPRADLRLDLDVRPPALSEAMRARLRTALTARRATNLKAFAAYVRRGVFPHNFVTSERLNVWRDPDGHLCAAATMIDRSGAHKLVAKVARNDNFIRLADVSSGPLLDWILTSGLTQAEVVAIQEPFMGPAPEAPRAQWMPAEDARLRARYAEVTAQLAAGGDASLDAAIDALATRPDLTARLLRAR